MTDVRITDILPLLKAPDDNVRLEAAKRLGELGTREAMETLKIAMNDENVAVRFYAKKAVKFIEQTLRASGVRPASAGFPGPPSSPVSATVPPLGGEGASSAPPIPAASSASSTSSTPASAGGVPAARPPEGPSGQVPPAFPTAPVASVAPVAPVAPVIPPVPTVPAAPAAPVKPAVPAAPVPVAPFDPQRPPASVSRGDALPQPDPVAPALSRPTPSMSSSLPPSDAPTFPPLAASWSPGREELSAADASLPGLPPAVVPTLSSSPASQPSEQVDVGSLSSLAREVPSPAFSGGGAPASVEAGETTSTEDETDAFAQGADLDASDGEDEAREPVPRARKWKAKTTSAIIGGRLIRLGAKKRRGADPRSGQPPMPGDPTYPGMPPQGLDLSSHGGAGHLQAGAVPPIGPPPPSPPGGIEVFSSHLDAILQDQADIAAAIADSAPAEVGAPPVESFEDHRTQSVPAPGAAASGDPYAQAFAREEIPRVPVPSADPFAEFMASLEAAPADENSAQEWESAPPDPPTPAVPSAATAGGSTYEAFMMGQGGGAATDAALGSAGAFPSTFPASGPGGPPMGYSSPPIPPSSSTAVPPRTRVQLPPAVPDSSPGGSGTPASVPPLPRPVPPREPSPAPAAPVAQEGLSGEAPLGSAQSEAPATGPSVSLPSSSPPPSPSASSPAVAVPPPSPSAPSPAVAVPPPSAPSVAPARPSADRPVDEEEALRLVRVGQSILRPCVQLLFNGLDVGEPQVAIACARALGRLGVQEAGSRVVGLLQGGLIDRDVILALGHFQDARVVEVLRKLYGDSRFLSLRPAVAEALTFMKVPEAWEFLKEILKGQDVDQTVQNTVVRFIGESGNEFFVDALVQQLGAVEEYFEITVIQALGSFAATHPRVKQRLVAGLAVESNPRKASCYLSALSSCTDSALVDDVEKYVRSRDRRVRSNAIELLSRLQVGDPVKLRILKPLLLDEDNRCRANACIALARIDERAVLETLEKMLRDRNKWYRASACYALGVLRPPQATMLLIQALRDPDTDVRINATKALRELEDAQVVQALSGITSDRNIWIRQYAIEALGRMQAPSAVTRLRAILRQESNSQVLAAALMALANCGEGEQVVKAIAEFLDHINDKVRLRAIEAYGRVMDGRNLNRLIPCLKDGDPRIRSAAVTEIWKFGEFGIVATLHEMLSSYDGEDRRAAAMALAQVGEVQRALRETEGVGRLVAALRRHPMYGKV